MPKPSPSSSDESSDSDSTPEKKSRRRARKLGLKAEKVTRALAANYQLIKLITEISRSWIYPTTIPGDVSGNE
jgi:hypothetical protein